LASDLTVSACPSARDYASATAATTHDVRVFTDYNDADFSIISHCWRARRGYWLEATV
jgi:hypothetical protein